MDRIFKIPSGAAEILRDCPLPRVHGLLSSILDAVYSGKHYMPVSSELMRDIVTARDYSTFLYWSRKLKQWLGRTEFYTTKEVESLTRPAECKAWLVNFDEIPRKSGENNNEGVLVGVPVPARLVYRMARLVRRRPVDVEFGLVVESALAFDGAVNVRQSNAYIGSLSCETKQQLDMIGASVRSVNSDVWNVSMDGGGRVYTPIVAGLKKDIRRTCLQFDCEVVDDFGEVFEFSEGAAEVDAKCCHYFMVAMAFSVGVERERMLSLIREDRFYESLSDDDLSRDKAKTQLLSALFQYKCKLDGWRRFSESFPNTAKSIEKIRDRDWVIRKRWFGEKLHATRYGQRKMSRILTRMETKVFNRAISRMWVNEGIPAIRVHDAVLVRASFVGVAEEYVKEAFLHWFGVEAPVDMTVFE